jgi:oligoendopeptidase F
MPAPDPDPTPGPTPGPASTAGADPTSNATAAAASTPPPDPEVVAARRFVPTPFDPADVEQITRLTDDLLARDLATPDAVAAWLADYGELTAVVSEAGSRRMIAKACDTDADDVDAAYQHWIQNVAPALAPIHDRLHRQYLAADARTAVDMPGRELMDKHWQADVDLYRDANVPLQVEIKQRCVDYDKLIGAMSVEVDGKTLTLPQASAKLESTDRARRESVWKQVAARRLDDRDAIDALFEDVLGLRRRIAENAGLDSYRDYAWRSFGRFDYTPEDCHRFADAVERVVVPALAARHRQRRAALGVETLRPWDLAVDPQGRDPLTPFDADDPHALVEKTRAVFEALDPSLAEAFGRLKLGRNLDLDSRQAKRAGGFQASLSESGEPFIFMNAAGVNRDVDTMLHEAGHAFHFLASFDGTPSIFVRHPPMEFAEVASMAMELLAGPHLAPFYDDADAARARVTHLESILRVFPWIATIDQFQHWLYTHPGHSRDQRTAAWLDLRRRFGTGEVDWTGLDAELEAEWHRQLHLFHHPFYYIEYGIAQLGALKVWANARRDPADALDRYRAALRLGGTRSLPELFDAAGVAFDLGPASLDPPIDDLVAELDRLDPSPAA